MLPAVRPRRPARSSAARRAQYARAEGRVVQHLLRSFDALEHRGCQPSAFGQSLSNALRGSRCSGVTSSGTRPLDANAASFVPSPHATSQFRSSPDLSDITCQLFAIAESLERVRCTMQLMFDAQHQLTAHVRSLGLEQQAKDAAALKEHTRILDEQEKLRAVELANRMERQKVLLARPSIDALSTSGRHVSSSASMGRVEQGVVSPGVGTVLSAALVAPRGTVITLDLHPSRVGFGGHRPATTISVDQRTSPWFTCGICTRKSYCSTYCHYCPDLVEPALVPLPDPWLDDDVRSVQSAPI